MEWNAGKPWYHGSPSKLTRLRIGSTITQDRDLARIFSHKPGLVSQDVDATGNRILKHTGTRPGYLYRLAEPVKPAEIEPHPASTMGAGQEWLTKREFQVELVEPTTPIPEEVLNAEEVTVLSRRYIARTD